MAPPLTVRSLARQATPAHHESNKRILSQAENLVRQHHAVGATQVWFRIPSWLFGLPVVDVHNAADFLEARLTKSGFQVQRHAPNPYAEPNVLWVHIDWAQPLQRVEHVERAKRNTRRREERKAAPKTKPTQESQPDAQQLLKHLRAASAPTPK
jgi:hypothetical protein